MTIEKLREKLHERISLYWKNAVVVWGATSKVKPKIPLVVLRLGTVTRGTQPIAHTKNGILFFAFPTEVSLQVDLFTKGKPVKTTLGGEYFENTAENDLLEFINFLDSPSTIKWSSENDITLLLKSGVQDLSEIINDSQWEYRAMAELSINFTQWTAEKNGVISENCITFDKNGIPTGIHTEDWEQTSSGGGSAELSKEEIGYFEEVAEIKGEYS